MGEDEGVEEEKEEGKIEGRTDEGNGDDSSCH